MGALRLIYGHKYSYIAIDSEIIRRYTDHEIWPVVAGAEAALRALMVSGARAAEDELEAAAEGEEEVVEEGGDKTVTPALQGLERFSQ